MKILHDEKVIEVTCGELLEMYKRYSGFYICFMLRKEYFAEVNPAPDTAIPDIKMKSFQVVGQFVDAQPHRFNNCARRYPNLSDAVQRRYHSDVDLDNHDRFGQRKTRVNLLRSIPADHVFRFEYEQTGGSYDRD